MQNALTTTYVPKHATLAVALLQWCKASERNLIHVEVVQLHKYIQIVYAYMEHKYIHNSLNKKNTCVDTYLNLLLKQVLKKLISRVKFIISFVALAIRKYSSHEFFLNGILLFKYGRQLI